MEHASNNNSAISPYDDDISAVEIVNAVLRNWRVVAILPIFVAIIAGVWSLTRDRTYAASASFMPQVAEGRGVSGAAALAQQFGVSLGTDRPGQSPQFYVDLLRSTRLLRQAVEEEYELPTADEQIGAGTLIEYWEFDNNSGSLPPWRLATEKLRAAISASAKWETGVVQLTVTSEHPMVAEQIAETLLRLLNDVNLEVRQRRAQEEGRFISGRITEARAELLAVEGALQDFLRQNRDFHNSPELTFEHDRLTRQVMMRQEVYTSLLRSQEQIRIDAVRDIPLFTVIDHPVGSAEPQGRGTVMRVLVAFALGLMLALLVAFLVEFSRRNRETQDPHYREFQGLTRELWDDIRHPSRWLRGREKAVPGGDR